MAHEQHYSDPKEVNDINLKWQAVERAVAAYCGGRRAAYAVTLVLLDPFPPETAGDEPELRVDTAIGVTEQVAEEEVADSLAECLQQGLIALREQLIDDQMDAGIPEDEAVDEATEFMTACWDGIWDNETPVEQG